MTALLFPTSDFRHPVTTPALLYISQALTRVQPIASLVKSLIDGSVINEACVRSPVSGEVTAGCDVRVSAVLSGSGIRLPLKALPARARQLPARNSAPGRAGQDRPGYQLTAMSLGGGGGSLFKPS